MSDTYNVAQADPNHFKIVQALGGSLADNLNDLPAALRMEVLIYALCTVFMGVTPVKGHTRLTAFDQYMAAARETLEKNIAIEGYEKENP